MRYKELRTWKKVFKEDLSYVALELKNIIKENALILLEGTLGAGKTTFVQAFVGEAEKTMSPSYSVLSETSDVLHADFYRVKNKEEIIHLELPLYLEDKKFFIVEWGERYYSSIERELPENYSSFLIKISINEDKTCDPSRNFQLFEL